jgi:hypothetical protein
VSSQKYAVCEVLLQMHLSRDRRTWTQQATSGVKIASAIVATAAALGLIASAYIRIARLDGGNHVTAGWLLLAAVTIVLSATAQYWGRWFYFLPGYVAMRSSIWMILGWFSPSRIHFCPVPRSDGNDGSLELPIQQVEKGPCG